MYVALARMDDARRASHPRLDDDAVDARVERGARCEPGARVRRAARESDKESSRTLILAASRLDALLGEDRAARWTRGRARCAEAELVGQRYHRPLDWVPYPAGAHEIIVGESFVTADDGSGVVHMAPAFGADDYAAGQRHGLAFLQPVDCRGRFPDTLPLVGGIFVKDADAQHHR